MPCAFTKLEFLKAEETLVQMWYDSRRSFKKKTPYINGHSQWQFFAETLSAISVAIHSRDFIRT